MMHGMRTTVTLDPDVELMVKRVMLERGLSFKQAINEAVRSGLAPRRTGASRPFPTHDMGDALIDVTKALRLSGELEDQELARRLTQGA